MKQRSKTGRGKRQSKYRSMLDRYMVKHGLKRDPKMGSGLFIGGELWVEEMRRRLAKLLKNDESSGLDPPGPD